MPFRIVCEDLSREVPDVLKLGLLGLERGVRGHLPAPQPRRGSASLNLKTRRVHTTVTLGVRLGISKYL